MRDQLLAYLLDDLDAQERQAVEEALARDPSLRSELDRLRECLQLGGASGECPTEENAPPCELASRTCSLVSTVIQRSRGLYAGRSGLSESHDVVQSRSRWSIADVAVAACVLVALGALVLPALRESRETTRRLQCQSNMQQLGTAFASYAERFNDRLPEVGPGENAGVYVVALAESGFLSREVLAQLVVCPSSKLAERVARGCVQIYIPTREEYTRQKGACMVQVRRFMGGDYAYNLGYRDSEGKLHQIRFVRRSSVPLLSDAPSKSMAGYRSENHGGCGQNILWQDLSCRYSTRCEQISTGDNYYLNDEGEQAAGCFDGDIVLAPSEVTPLLSTLELQSDGGR